MSLGRVSPQPPKQPRPGPEQIQQGADPTSTRYQQGAYGDTVESQVAREPKANSAGSHDRSLAKQARPHKESDAIVVRVSEWLPLHDALGPARENRVQKRLLVIRVRHACCPHASGHKTEPAD